MIVTSLLSSLCDHFDFRPTRGWGGNAALCTVAVYECWAVCSVAHQKKSVIGCSMPNRLSLEAF